MTRAKKIKLDQLRDELAVAVTTGSYQRAGELAYGRIPELEKELKDIEARQPARSAAMNTESLVPEAMALAAKIKQILAGNDPGVQGAALAELVAIFIAGHHPTLRGEMARLFFASAADMVDSSARDLFGPAGWPR